MFTRLVLSLCVLAALTAASHQKAEAATVAWWTFTPDRGGPGAVIHVKGGHWFISEPVVGIYLVLPLATNQEGQITKFQPLGGPLATAQLDTSGGFDVTIVVPGAMPEGSPINTSALGLAVMGERSYALHGPRGIAKPFRFISATLPAGGKAGSSDMLLWAVSAGVVLLIGASARWKASHTEPKRNTRK